VDLALVALLTERAYLDGLPETSPMPGPPEAMVPRLGEYLLEQGLLSPDQLEKALKRQTELAELGQRQLLGQTLVKLGFVDRETLDRAITRQPHPRTAGGRAHRRIAAGAGTPDGTQPDQS
jgi:hypothetical protein